MKRTFALIGMAAIVATALPALAQTAPATALVGDEEAGRELYAMECRACHSGAIAPALRGIAGRKIASIEDFHGYSDGLKAKSSETWTDEALDAFLKAPTEFAPGVRMFKATPEDQMRADLIAYLKSLPPPRTAP